MSGLIKTGTAVQEGLVLAAGVAKTWQHNRGQKALAVRAYAVATGQVEVVTVAQATVNQISVTSAGGATVNVFVDFGVPSPNRNSIRGVKGVVAATTGFV